MSLTINRLFIRADTADGSYGVDIKLSKGLFILRVENTHGKSTCINSIAYALGMEMALGQPSSKPPFPPSLLKSIQNENGIEKPVISSYVMLEISNDRQETYTLKREILGADAASIITAYPGGIDSFTGAGLNLFLHREGDTTRELGFYHWLAQFISWELPFVPNNDGGELPLYPVLLFPLFFVEQKKGWGSIQATTPFNLQIAQAKKRAFEFLMKMDVNETIIKKARNKQLIEDVLDKWKFTYAQLESASLRIDAVFQGVKESPSANFDSTKLDLLLENKGSWQSLNSSIINLRSDLNKHVNSAQKAINGNNQPELLNQIKNLNSLLLQSDSKYEFLVEEISFMKHQIDATKLRVDSLEDDKRKYEDLKKVKGFNSLNNLPALNNECPTCGREYSDHSVELECSDDLMTLVESLDFIKSQIKTFKSVSNSYVSQLEVKNLEVAKIEQEIERHASELSRLKHQAYSDKYTVNEEFLREKIRLENKIEDYQNGLVQLAGFRSKFDILHAEYKSLVEVRKGFPEHGFSQTDIEKLDSVRNAVVKYLTKFGFSSFDPELLEISKENYLPTREGFDLGFDTSASDGIRIIWSYLLSLFSVRKEYETNHPGFLVFDEPRQQEANKLSFTGLLQGASEVADSGQIIFATSEEEDILNSALDGYKYTLKSFSKKDGKILRKLNSN